MCMYVCTLFTCPSPHLPPHPTYPLTPPTSSPHLPPHPTYLLTPPTPSAHLPPHPTYPLTPPTSSPSPSPLPSTELSEYTLQLDEECEGMHSLVLQLKQKVKDLEGELRRRKKHHETETDTSKASTA